MKILQVVFELRVNVEAFEENDRCILFLQLLLVRRQICGSIPIVRLCLRPVRCVSMADKDRFLKVFQVCPRPVVRTKAIPNNLQFILCGLRNAHQKSSLEVRFLM
jgi:hypothetical protein